MKKLTQFKKGLMASVALGLFATGTAAAQTAAETNVDNTFSLVYDINGSEQPEINNDDDPTRFVVDRLIDLTVTNTGGNTTVAPGQESAETTFTLTNDGNGDQAYDLSVVNTAITTDDFDPTSPTATGAVEITYFLSSAPTVGITFDPTDTDTFPVLAPDETITVTVEQDIPTGLDDTNEGQIILVADTLSADDFSEELADDDTDNDLLASENILADGTSTDEEVANAGDDSAIGTYIVAEADVTGVKTVAIVAEDGGTAANCAGLATPTTSDQYSIPGACVEYVITVTNSDTRDATGIDVTDNLPSELTFVSATTAGFTLPAAPAVPLTFPAVGADCGAVAGCPVVLSNASLPASATTGGSTVGTVTIRALLK